jgi:uncharacterized membrane protein
MENKRTDRYFISSLHEWLLASCAFSCALLLGRIIATGSLNHLFLTWNLFLAFIPYWITRWMTNNISIMENRFKLILALTAWLIFIPNSFYIITDLFHLNRHPSAPKWFDLLMIFSFAWNGIIAGIVSLRKVELIIRIIRGKSFSVVIVFAVMFLSALGIYIGRFLRFNSWDVITNPFSLVEEIGDMLIHPFDHGYAWGMTLCYSVFMTLVYFTFKRMGDSFYSRED